MPEERKKGPYGDLEGSPPIPIRRHRDSDPTRTRGVPDPESAERQEENRDQQDILQDLEEDASDARGDRGETEEQG